MSDLVLLVLCVAWFFLLPSALVLGSFAAPWLRREEAGVAKPLLLTGLSLIGLLTCDGLALSLHHGGWNSVGVVALLPWISAAGALFGQGLGRLLFGLRDRSQRPRLQLA